MVPSLTCMTSLSYFQKALVKALPVTKQNEQVVPDGDQQILQDDQQEAEGEGEQKAAAEDQHDEAALNRGP